MCGIVGYIGSGDTTKILLEGLRRLEYRGYDSAGICINSKQHLTVFKKQGRVSELSGSLPENGMAGQVGVAHTRWATHGVPNEVNAHPHLDCSGEVAIVHNGIVENYQSLRELLVKEGHKIVSETDSEILAHLIEKFYEGNLEEAVLRALKLVEGTFGLGVLHKSEQVLVAARRGSPLVVGVGGGEMFISSDVSAI